MMTNTPTPTDSAGLYSAPRKFDLSTMLVVTTAYAAAFALLRAIRVPATAVLIVAAFFTSIALGQAILFGAKRPRLASAMVGSVSYFILLIAYSPLDQHVTTFVLSLIFGAFWGYVGGVIVGSVFMVAHWVRFVLSPGDSRPNHIG